MEQPRHRIDMRRYAIVNAVLAAMAALVLAFHDDPCVPVPTGPPGPARAGGGKMQPPSVPAAPIGLMLKRWSRS